jgi:hypothetical protein
MINQNLFYIILIFISFLLFRNFFTKHEHYNILLIIIFYLLYRYLLSRNLFLKKEHYSNHFYNNKCSNENKPNDIERKECFNKILSNGSSIYEMCKNININEGINEEDSNDFCKKWIGLLNTECTLEDCLENTYEKIKDLDSFTEYKNKFKQKKDFANKLFKYNSEINNDYFKDYNLKLNELDILIQNFNINKKKFNDKYSNDSKAQSLITDLLNDNISSNIESLKIYDILNNYPLEEAHNIIDKYREIDLINLLIKSNYKIEEELLKKKLDTYSKNLNNKSKKILNKLFYNHITDYDETQLIKISNNPNFFLIKKNNNLNDPIIQEEKHSFNTKIKNGNYYISFDNPDNITKYGSTMSSLNNVLLFENKKSYKYDFQRNIYVNSDDNNKYIYYDNNNIIDEENIYIKIVNINNNNNDIENNNINIDNNNNNTDKSVIHKINYNYPKIVKDFINNVEIECNFNDNKLVDIAAAYYYNQKDSIIMDYVNDIYDSKSNTNKNDLYKCIYNNIQKLTFDLIENNQNIFNELINKTVFIEDLKTCNFDSTKINSITNILEKNPNIDYSFSNKTITLNDTDFNYTGNSETCIRNTILKYTNFLRDTNSRNI